jgi:hypothetical protein
MKKHASLFTFILVIVLACNSTLENIMITPDISISIPGKYKLMVKDSVNYLKTWKTTINDDQFSIYRYTINQPESLPLSIKKQDFKKNIDAFLQAFNLTNIDSTIVYKENLFQCDLKFDFMDNNNKYGLYGKFLVHQNNFIAIFYQIPYPINQYSQRTRDKILGSVISK